MGRQDERKGTERGRPETLSSETRLRRPFEATRAFVGDDVADVRRGFERYGQGRDRIDRNHGEHHRGRTKPHAMRTVSNAGMLGILVYRRRVSRSAVLTRDLADRQRFARPILEMHRCDCMVSAAIARNALPKRCAEAVDRKRQRQQQEHCAPDQGSHATKSGEHHVDDDFPACSITAPVLLRDRMTWINDRIRNRRRSAPPAMSQSAPTPTDDYEVRCRKSGLRP